MGFFFHLDGTTGSPSCSKETSVPREEAEEVVSRKLRQGEEESSGRKNEIGGPTGKKAASVRATLMVSSRILRGKIRWFGSCNKAWQFVQENFRSDAGEQASGGVTPEQASGDSRPLLATFQRKTSALGSPKARGQGKTRPTQV
jgi:hypothetical protein